jgi:hypothetical protein
MHYFDVFQHPVAGVEAIKHGFCWPALFLGWLWVLFHRIWLCALVLLAFPAIGAVMLVIAPSASSLLVFSLLALIPWMLAGFKGNEWRRSDLSKRGFTYIGTFQTDTPDAAVAIATRTKQQQPPSPKPTKQQFFDAVAKEIAQRQIDHGLWTRAFAETNGNNERARALYIRMRVDQLEQDASCN